MKSAETVGLEILLELAERHIRTVVIDQGDSLTPLCHIVGADNQHQIVMMVFKNEEEERKIIEQVKGIAKSMDAKAVVTVAETWMYISHAEHAEQLMRPSVHPNRMDAVVAIATDGKNTVHKIWEIVRKDGKAISLVKQSGNLPIAMLNGIMRDIMPVKHGTP